MTRVVVISVAALCALVACGGSDERRPRPSATPERPRSSPTAVAARAQGEVTYCFSRFNRLSERPAVRRFNAAHADRGLRARGRSLPLSGADLADGLESRSGRGCDVALVELPSVAQLAYDGALTDLTKYMDGRSDEFLAPAREAVRWDDRAWAVPRRVDAGLLYYRVDAGTPPLTWQEVYAGARGGRGLVYQGAAYHGLTVNFLELAYAAGARVLSSDGRHSEIGGPAALRALTLMRKGIATGAVSPAVLRGREEEARRAFEAGRATFMRNWPYASELLEARRPPRGVGDFDTIQLPGFGDRGPTSVLFGWAVVMSAAPRDEDAALALVDYLTRESAVRHAAKDYGSAPALDASWADPAVTDHLFVWAELEHGLRHSRPLPITPAYWSVSDAISRNVHAALAGQLSPRRALQRADREIERALAEFP